jgi:maleate isomerase
LFHAGTPSGKRLMPEPRYKIGLIVPANNSVIEPELWSLSLPDVAFYATRIMAKGNLTGEAVLKMEATVDRAVDELVATGVDVIVYADMVTTFIMDRNWNEIRTAEISNRAGIPCVSAWTALRDALERLEIARFAVGTPYPANIHELVPDYFTDKGYVITADATLDVLSMREVAKVKPGSIVRVARSISMAPAEAVVFLATDLHTFDILDEMENELGLPVLSSNQTILWAALKTVGYPAETQGPGRLFAQ